MRDRRKTGNEIIHFSTLSIVILMLFSSCSSTTLLFENTMVTFDKEQYAVSDKYICTIEGQLINSKGEYVAEKSIAAASIDYKNLRSTISKTGIDGKFSVQLYWIDQPFIYADVFPNPAQSSLTSSGFSYLKNSRTITLDVPVYIVDKQQPLINTPITMYGLSFALRRMAEDVVNKRLIRYSFTAQDYETGLTINGAKITLRGEGIVPSPDSLLTSYIVSDTLRTLAIQNTNEYVVTEQSEILAPDKDARFNVLTFSNYTVRFEHPQYHTAIETLYVERAVEKIFRVTQVGALKKYDFIDQ